MATPYREKLEKIRLAVPQPVSDRVHDSYFVHSSMRALDLVDALKSEFGEKFISVGAGKLFFLGSGTTSVTTCVRA